MKGPRGFRISIMMLTAATLVAAGCSDDPSVLAVPGAGVRGPTYPIHIQFADTLNLPSHARVMANGAQVGRLDRVSVVDPSAAGPGSVRADVSIERTVALPATVTAQLRQDTILGDLYIALNISPGSAASILRPGDTVPVRQTEPALQIEDVLSGLATFVSGGAVHSAQRVIDRVNAAMPDQPGETGRIAGTVKADLIDVGAHLDAIDGFLDSIGANARLILDNEDALGELLTPDGAVTITEIAASLIHVIGIIGSLGGVAHALEWVAPLAMRAMPLLAPSFRCCSRRTGHWTCRHRRT